jgi:hypothetical protein
MEYDRLILATPAPAVKPVLIPFNYFIYAAASWSLAVSSRAATNLRAWSPSLALFLVASGQRKRAETVGTTAISASSLVVQEC